ncbi:PREDICTED: putative uncharacterized protein DDB_G0286901 [Rhagoletis zephyria]|uniref:putative uncharacterized protein DDB_G0286901 n=1 Tax=Rhagoletis zephyria TaxID=28612 RepID=UPI00081131BE|nr:PREDICTED: putative uncharacterized protein DDB_G0286901 [Rhagoletis zephyria]XP_017490847.1 PREDICTED: putative uncharacterized protein DDB_G0286901 [Rhagoletis zephyria]XP_017490855.1 PREDICTED: putative uncharacterized protein DDB_G0286901 [Rhagoletis zephyria]
MSKKYQRLLDQTAAGVGDTGETVEGGIMSTTSTTTNVNAQTAAENLQTILFTDSSRESSSSGSSSSNTTRGSGSGSGGAGNDNGNGNHHGSAMRHNRHVHVSGNNHHNKSTSGSSSSNNNSRNNSSSASSSWEYSPFDSVSTNNINETTTSADMSTVATAAVTTATMTATTTTTTNLIAAGLKSSSTSLLLDAFDADDTTMEVPLLGGNNNASEIYMKFNHTKAQIHAYNKTIKIHLLSHAQYNVNKCNYLHYCDIHLNIVCTYLCR